MIHQLSESQAREMLKKAGIEGLKHLAGYMPKKIDRVPDWTSYRPHEVYSIERIVKAYEPDEVGWWTDRAMADSWFQWFSWQGFSQVEHAWAVHLLREIVKREPLLTTDK